MKRSLCSVALVLFASTAALAQDAPPPAPQPPPADGAPAPEGKPKPKRIIAAIGVALPFYIYARPAGAASARHFTPDERTSIAQSVTLGYVVNPKVSVLLSGLFLETLRTDTPMAKTGFAFGGITALVQYRFYKTMSFAAGPMYFYREYFSYESDIGAFYALTYGIPLPKEFVMSLALNSPQAYMNKPVFAVAAGVNVARRF